MNCISGGDMSILELQPLETLEASATADEPSHQYHAEAHAVSGYLHHPVYQRINKKANVSLRDYRDGHVQERENAFTLEGLVSFTASRSRVSGSRSLKNKGWITLSTSIVEGFNVLEIITADRVVSQVSTEHAYRNGHVPSVTFLGSQFVNLRLSGFPLEPKFNFGICEDKPEGETPYVKHLGFLLGIRDQIASIVEGDLPNSVLETYSKRLKVVDDLIAAAKVCEDCGQNGDRGMNGAPIAVTCSLITKIDIDHIPIPGLKTAGNILFIPEFGTVALGEVVVRSSRDYDGKYDNYFNLKMLDMKLGCVGDGNVIAGNTIGNGHHNP
jgi:hypothetical protein